MPPAMITVLGTPAAAAREASCSVVNVRGGRQTAKTLCIAPAFSAYGTLASRARGHFRLARNRDAEPAGFAGAEKLAGNPP